MKKFMMAGLVALCLLMSGCSSKGKVVTITTEELKTKMEQKETFAVIFTQPECAYCKEVMKMLDDSYLKSNQLTLYDVVLDRSNMSTGDWEILLMQIKEYFPQMSNTPDLYYVKDGTIMAQFDTDLADMFDEAKFDEWVRQYNLVK